MSRDFFDDRVGMIRRFGHGVVFLRRASGGREDARGTFPARSWFYAAVTALLAGCSAPLSTLDPAGPPAAAIDRLWWAMLAGAGAIFALVVAILAYAFLRSDREIPVHERRWLVGGGIVFPSVTLLSLLAVAVWTGERLLPRSDPEALKVDALARQFQWEFSYPDRAGAAPSPVLAIPVGRTVEVRVTSTDVIHSFWVPRLAGKIDAVPGHVNVIRISADRPGAYLGQCSEFCGIGHAGMQFRVEALPDEEFARFLAAGAPAPGSAAAREGSR